MAQEQQEGNIMSEYTVEERDTIQDLEKKFGLSWQEICAANKEVIKDTNVLQAGIKINIPYTA